jgi:hypothetical protein
MIGALASLLFAFAGVVSLASIADSLVKARRAWIALMDERDS